MRHRTITAVMGAAVLAAAAVPASGVAAAAVRSVPGPDLRLVSTQPTVTVVKFRHYPVFVDPNIFVASYRSALQLDVRRASYTTPVTLTQIIKTPWGTTERHPLRPLLLDGWNGLKDFIKITIRNSSGTVIRTRRITFCPSSYGAERATPDSAMTDHYPQGCGSFDPFPLGQVWGLPRGWAVDPANGFFGSGGSFRLAVGTYRLTETITPRYRTLFLIGARAATASINLRVVKVSVKCGPFGCPGTPAARPGTHAGVLPTLPSVRTMTNPPRDALPQLTALPSWGISTSTQSGLDFLDFGATVWVGGNSPLDVEGFHVAGSSMLRAYQYFWRDGKVIGRAPVGWMGFDTKVSHNHWHFEQFARYRLLTASKTLAVRSHKVGFCIAPTDAVDMTLPHAVWQPFNIGLSGQCGVPGALWVREYLPVGWGDTYGQFKAGQAFNITNLPNGTYYIEVIANPLRRLHELSTAGDVSFRKVILGGTKGDRTVTVPAWHGIDPEQ